MCSGNNCGNDVRGEDYISVDGQIKISVDRILHFSVEFQVICNTFLLIPEGKK
jgi:hypothetical protein